ncbi:hypothetical protein [Novosphingobium sp. JCM 18896]|uniref:hypothetical protein n=1 Tax=Novosphingobium sp. JCM 18896 TaxID=2989731 RepID=UPI002221628E|nr:hypothetical protein [Novosphingobium sp. JCM 18896]MCW1429771.1 hypothetical protein [Novosphingobium sp. JCM 18896]
MSRSEEHSRPAVHETGNSPPGAGENRASATMAIMLAALAMIAIAGFWMIGTEAANVARGEYEAFAEHQAAAKSDRRAPAPNRGYAIQPQASIK